MKSKVFVLMAVLAMMNSGVAALVMHLDADSLGLADGAPVATWTDQSGLGNDATQTTAGAQPTFVASNAAFNGHATVAFGGDDYMYLNNSMVNVSTFSLFIVGNFEVTGLNQYFISAQGGAGNDRLRVAGYSWGDGYMTRIGNTGDKNLGGPQDTVMHVIAVTGTAAGWLDLGAKQVVGSNTSTEATSDLILGAYYDVGDFARDFLNGNIAEVILYNEILSDNDVAAMNAQLYATYVPEPATMVLLGLGALVLRRRQ